MSKFPKILAILSILTFLGLYLIIKTKFQSNTLIQILQILLTLYCCYLVIYYNFFFEPQVIEESVNQ